MQYTLSDFTKWAEENVQSGDFSWRKAIEMFKESRNPKPDWEILSFKGTLSTNKELCTKGDDALFRFAGGWPTYGFRKEDMISRDDYVIYSVRRLSDGEVFTVGDLVKPKFNDVDKSASEILSFSYTTLGDSHIIYANALNEGAIGVNITSIDKCTPLTYEIVARLQYDENPIDGEISAIKMIRRLCDSRLFSLGDHVQYEDHRGIVNEFHVNDKGQMEVHCNDGTIVFPLEDLKLLLPVLFTTSDGMTICAKDTYFTVGERWGVSSMYAAYPGGNSWNGEKPKPTFSTKDAAKEYIIKNKPCLSFNDIIDSFAKANVSGQFYGDSMEEIYKLVNTRIGFHEP